MLGVSVQFLRQVVSCSLMLAAFHGPGGPIQMLCLKQGSSFTLSNSGRLSFLPGMVASMLGGAVSGSLLWRTAEYRRYQHLACCSLNTEPSYLLTQGHSDAISGMSGELVSLLQSVT